MRYLKYILIALIIAAAAYIRPPAPEIWETKTDKQASVTIAVTPLDVSEGSAEWTFEVVMDTHSVELEQDMTEVAALVDSGGNEYKPIRWEGPAGGHHRGGSLVFSPIRPRPQSFELRIVGIGDIARSFVW
ncbi:hypothetical protein A2755_01740 [Candidatus Wolfebacteria bacterium RIFCSPHIGHO2_01_FULL_48_22]|uniref:Uncharacterized protein n=2 Tax=Candidatus Wolfeibacteriota TaxID=1752735 RepID=A0A1F8DR58_9BACT|nr:MAG: hypothetical protein A2755_01740 [Candidatus Wolfebacteria bacterium RIFCSPHIGHO2_01_FULL_48_22]OGM91957.1 MAG: hypothetical protein A2935_02380 [Candidatus Wolfebacteria bacterium RIFCSPLOWO2_01_FULL_47_17b]